MRMARFVLGENERIRKNTMRVGVDWQCCGVMRAGTNKYY
jgi:hypothetical protein